MIDNYCHSDSNIIYITESIPGPLEESLEYDVLFGNYNSQMLHSCTCNNICKTLDCKCLKIGHGLNNDTYNAQHGKYKTKIYKTNHTNSYPIIECNSNCTCSEDCGNRIVQKGPVDGLVVKLCENTKKGLGMFTSRYIPVDTFVCEYAGELLTKSQALSRSKDNDILNKMNYVFCLNEYTQEGVLQTFVDPKNFGNIGRYINHSCDPNCIVVPVRYKSIVPHLAIFATKDIHPGTEITFSYGVGNIVVESQVLQKQKPCCCNTENCNGFMPFDNF